MQITNSGIILNLNQNTTYSSATGLWTLGNSHAYHNAVINYGYYFAGFIVKSSNNLSIPAGASTENIYFLFQDGNDIGLAISLENASSKIPIVFATAGDFFYFKQTGDTYNLNPINSCCAPDYFETQYPEVSSYSAALDGGFNGGNKSRFPIPCYLPKKISFAFPSVNSMPSIANIDLYLKWYSPNPVSSYYINYQPFLSYSNGWSDLYSSSTETRFSASLNFLYNPTTDTILTLLGLHTWFGPNPNQVTIYNLYTLDNPTIYDANNNLVDDFFSNVFTLNLEVGSGPATLTLTPDGNYVEDLLPETITLTKINSPETINGIDFEPTVLRINKGLNPEHNWTVNDYDDELPETITLNKVSFSNYESESFTTAVNVTNKIKLKLANSVNGFYGYLFFIYKDEDVNLTGFYLPGYCKWVQELTEDPNDIYYIMPTKVSYGPVQFRLFKMAGIPAPLSGRCFADVIYKVVDPNE